MAGAAALLLLLSPLLAAIALTIRFTSDGPALYGSRRVGLGQRVFTCLRFRTMCIEAEQRQAELEHLNQAEGALFKIAADPRVTPVGRWLRRYSLDELPQLYNVVRGDMSLVGPRPLAVRDFGLLNDWEKRRQGVLPGLAGPGQTRGRSDLAILARTPGAVLIRRGAC